MFTKKTILNIHRLPENHSPKAKPYAGNGSVNGYKGYATGVDHDVHIGINGYDEFRGGPDQLAPAHSLTTTRADGAVKTRAVVG